MIVDRMKAYFIFVADAADNVRGEKRSCTTVPANSSNGTNSRSIH